METTSQAGWPSTRDRADSTPANGAPTSLWFEVRHADGQEATITIEESRFSIGGREDCAIRLPHGDDRVDCLIIRGPSGGIARNWSGLARFNGSSFQDARLQAGDILEINGTTIRVLGSEPVGSAVTEVLAARTHDDDGEARQSETIESTPTDPNTPSAPLPSNRRLATDGFLPAHRHSASAERDRCRRLIARLRRHSQLQQREQLSWSRARSRLERRLAAYSRLAVRLQDRIHAELRPRLEEIESKRVRLEQRACDLEGIQAQFHTAHEEVQRRLQQLKDQGESNQTKEQELADRAQTLDVRESELAAKQEVLDESAAEMTAHKDDLAEQYQALAHQRECLASQLREIADARSLEDQRHELEIRAVEISQMAEALDQKQFFLNEAEQALDAERREMQVHEEALQREMESLRQARDHAEQEVKVSRDVLGEAQSQLRQEQESHADSTGRFALSQQRARDLETALQDAHSELEQLARQVADLTENNLTAHQDHRQLRETIERLEDAKSAELDQLETSHRELKETLAQWQRQQAVWEQERAQLTAEIDQLRTQEKSIADDYEQRIVSLAEELEQLRTAERDGKLDDSSVREEPTSIQQPTATLLQLPAATGQVESPTLSVDALRREMYEEELLRRIGELEERLQQAETSRQEWEAEREHLVTNYEQQINEITHLIRDLPGSLQDDGDAVDDLHAPSIPLSSIGELEQEPGQPTTLSNPTLQLPIQVDLPPSELLDTHSNDADEPELASAEIDDGTPLDMALILAKYGLEESQELEPTDASPLDPPLSHLITLDSGPPEDLPAVSPGEVPNPLDEENGDEVNEAAREDSDHRESIETYMNRLLGQLPSDWAADSGNESIEPAKGAVAAAQPATPEGDANSSRAESPREKPSLPPKRANPLANTDLSAMRELAITSSRMAIQHHDIRRKTLWLGAGLTKILIAVLAGLIVSVWGRSLHPSISWSGLVFAPLAVILAYNHFVSPFRKRRLQAPGTGTNARESTSDGSARKAPADSRRSRK